MSNSNRILRIQFEYFWNNCRDIGIKTIEDGDECLFHGVFDFIATDCQRSRFEITIRIFQTSWK